MTAPDSLAPYAAHVRLAAPADGLDDPPGLVATLLEDIAAGALAAGASLVGHIKCLVKADATASFRVNLTDPRGGARVAGDRVASAAVLDIDLVVLVYGLDHAALSHAVSEAVDALAVTTGCAREIDVRSHGHDHEVATYPHGHDHQHAPGHSHDHAPGYSHQHAPRRPHQHDPGEPSGAV